MKDYERINFNIKTDLLSVVDTYCSNGYGRSALLNFLVSEALGRKNVVAVLDAMKAQQSEK